MNSPLQILSKTMKERFAVIEYYSGTLLDLYNTLQDAVDAAREASEDGGCYKVFKRLEPDEMD